VTDDTTCEHIPAVIRIPSIAAQGCETCLELGRHDWFHLRYCQTCGRVGCCDDSPGKHATAHYHSTAHPLIRSYEQEEDWFWCFVDGLGFEVDDAPPAPAFTEDLR
jgi:uncharacterized UBP type Zn finger protein